MNRRDIKHLVKKVMINSLLFRKLIKLLLKQGAEKPVQFDFGMPSHTAENALRKIYSPSANRQPKPIYHYKPSLALSIILPVYNVEKYLDACLGALLPDGAEETFEIIAVNDGSTDSSRSVLERFQRDHFALKIIDQDNGGLSAARNAGLVEARGRYVAFVDSDDVVSCDELLLATSLLEKSSADYISGNYRRIDDQGMPFGAISSVTTLMVPWGRVFRREVWQDMRFPEGYWYEDLIMPYLVESRFKGLETDSITYLYRDRPGSIVNSTAGNPKGLDSFYLIGYMLDECERLGIPFDKVFETTLNAMGPTLLNRSTALNPSQMKQLFYACCDLVQPLEEFSSPHCDLGWCWEALRTSLLARDYQAWCASCLAIALEQEAGGAKRAFELLSAERRKR